MKIKVKLVKDKVLESLLSKNFKYTVDIDPFYVLWKLKALVEYIEYEFIEVELQPKEIVYSKKFDVYFKNKEYEIIS